MSTAIIFMQMCGYIKEKAVNLLDLCLRSMPDASDKSNINTVHVPGCEIEGIQSITYLQMPKPLESKTY